MTDNSRAITAAVAGAVIGAVAGYFLFTERGRLQRADRPQHSSHLEGLRRANGGDLDWNAPANFVKPFSDAMVSLQKGKFTTTPVQTQFGWHVIQLDDVREAKVPGFDEVKQQLAQRAQGQIVEQYLRELRSRNGF